MNTSQHTSSETARPSLANAPGLRLFWQPGCSSCVKVKEMLTELKVPFTSVNLLENDDAMDVMIAHGARAVPVLIRDNEMIFAQSLEDVAKFVGVERTAKRLPPEVLMTRWRYFLDTAMGLIEQLPADKLKVHPVPGRARTVCSLSYHIFQVAEGFLGVMHETLDDSRVIDNADYHHLETKEQILGYARDTVGKLDTWWNESADKTAQRTFHTYYGQQPMHQILDRATWHSAQHTRQLGVVLDGFGIKANKPIDPKAYEGLPMPEAIWE